MKEQGRILLVTTRGDLSLNFFIKSRKLKTDYLFYDDPLANFQKTLKNRYDYVYFRDPFNVKNWQADRIDHITELVSGHQSNAYFVDRAKSYNDLLIEDKWRQYQLFSEIMPQSRLIKSFEDVNYDEQLVKRRISSRGYGIFFSSAKVPDNARPDDYIVQTKISIKKEYRAFMIGGTIISPLTIRTSRLPGRAVRTIGIDSSYRPAIENICTHVCERLGLDLLGIDIAETGSGFTLLEVNRSCQFKAYHRISGINLADNLYEILKAITLDKLARKRPDGHDK